MVDMNSIQTILRNSFAKEIRSKSFFVFSFFTLIVIALMTIGLVLVQEFLTENQNIQQMVGGKSIILVYRVVDFWAVFISIVFGISAVQSDLDFMIMPQILSHPISRTDYLIGRIGGAWLMVGIYYLLSLFLAITVFSITTGESAFNSSIVLAFFPSMICCLAIIVLSVFASLIMARTTALISMSFFCFLLTISNAYYLERGLDGLDGGMLAVKAVGLLFHWIFPRIGVMSKISENVVYSSNAEINYLIELPHFFLILGFMLFLLNHRFKSRDI